MFIFYDESILSYVSSLRDYFGLKSSYKPNQKFSDLLNKEKPKKVFLILIDGMGANLVHKHLDKDSFLNKYMKYTVQTVFPTTTTAALMSIQNGKAPNENGWLAWTQYVKEIDDIIIPFLNKGFYNKKQYEVDYFDKLVPIKTTAEELNEKGINASTILPDFEDEKRHNFAFPIVGKEKNTSFEDFCGKIINNDMNSNDKYVFCYYDTLDHVMHTEGPSSSKSKELLRIINNNLEKTAKQLSKDSMMIIVADHGQIDTDSSKFIILKDSKYEKYLKMYIYLDPRAAGFDIKDEYKEEFEKEFIDDFENDFVLLNKQQILDTKLFGYNENNPKFLDFLPDYLAIGKTDKLLYAITPGKNYKGHHTGISDDEVYIPIVIYKK